MMWYLHKNCKNTPEIIALTCVISNRLAATDLYIGSLSRAHRNSSLTEGKMLDASLAQLSIFSGTWSKFCLHKRVCYSSEECKWLDVSEQLPTSLKNSLRQVRRSQSSTLWTTWMQKQEEVLKKCWFGCFDGAWTWCSEVWFQQVHLSSLCIHPTIGCVSGQLAKHGFPLIYKGLQASGLLWLVC